MKNLEGAEGQKPDAESQFIDEWHTFLSELYDDNGLYEASAALERARIKAEGISDKKKREEALVQVKDGEIELAGRKERRGLKPA